MLLWKYHGLSPWKWSKNWRCFFFIEIAVSCDRKRLVILVGGIPKPSEKWWSSSVGMMKFPTEWKVIIQSYIQSCSSHHQPVIYIYIDINIYIYIYIYTYIHAWSKGIPHASFRCFSRCLGRTGFRVNLGRELPTVASQYRGRKPAVTIWPCLPSSKLTVGPW